MGSSSCGGVEFASSSSACWEAVGITGARYDTGDRRDAEGWEDAEGVDAASSNAALRFLWLGTALGAAVVATGSRTEGISAGLTWRSLTAWRIFT